jgi:hypothetical protein
MGENDDHSLKYLLDNELKSITTFIFWIIVCDGFRQNIDKFKIKK